MVVYGVTDKQWSLSDIRAGKIAVRRLSKVGSEDVGVPMSPPRF